MRADDTLASPRGVIFMPAAVEALMGRFLVPNLTGRTIVDGRSSFTLADVESKCEIVRADLGVVVDTTLPFKLATAPCSPDGVPAGRAALVERGRLNAPVLDLSTASELGREPTPSPRGRPLMLLQSDDAMLDLCAGLDELREGVAVRELPGLHTQAAHRWTYALVVPDAQAVHEGALAGRVSVRLQGNLLEHLRAPSTRLLRVPGELNPALLVRDGIGVEPA